MIAGDGFACGNVSGVGSQQTGAPAAAIRLARAHAIPWAATLKRLFLAGGRCSNFCDD